MNEHKWEESYSEYRKKWERLESWARKSPRAELENRLALLEEPARRATKRDGKVRKLWKRDYELLMRWAIQDEIYFLRFKRGATK